LSIEEFQQIQGTNDVSDNVVSNCYVYSNIDKPLPDIAATLVVAEGQLSSIDNPLLLCRYHHLQDYSQEFGNDFFQAIQAGKYGLDCGKDFVEVNRNGGYSGITDNPHSDKLLRQLQESLLGAK